MAIKLHRAGRGPTVLFLHGAGGVPQGLPFFEALAERYELLVPEHPGFGDSDDPPWIHSMPDPARRKVDGRAMRRDRENQLDLADVRGEANASTHDPNIRSFVRQPEGVDTGIVAVESGHRLERKWTAKNARQPAGNDHHGRASPSRPHQDRRPARRFRAALYRDDRLARWNCGADGWAMTPSGRHSQLVTVGLG
jgi:hypothetical protein